MSICTLLYQRRLGNVCLFVCLFLVSTAYDQQQLLQPSSPFWSARFKPQVDKGYTQGQHLRISCKLLATLNGFHVHLTILIEKVWISHPFFCFFTVWFKFQYELGLLSQVVRGIHCPLSRQKRKVFNKYNSKPIGQQHTAKYKYTEYKYKYNWTTEQCAESPRRVID